MWLAHLLTALGIFGALAMVHAPWWFIAAALALGAVTVQLTWRYLLFDPFVFLARMPISFGDPIMGLARQTAAETFGLFLEIYERLPTYCEVRFRYETDAGVLAFPWGDLLEWHGDRAVVYLRERPRGHEGGFERFQQVRREDIDDWMVVLPNGQVRGGFTNQALCRIFARDTGQMPARLRLVLERFVDPLPEGETRDPSS